MRPGLHELLFVLLALAGIAWAISASIKASNTERHPLMVDACAVKRNPCQFVDCKSHYLRRQAERIA